MTPTIEVEVVFASPERQALCRVQVAQGCTAAEAIAVAGLSADWLSASGVALPLSRFGRLIEPEQVLSANDRVEILRPLVADPKDQRHQRVKAARQRRARAINGL